MPELHGEELMTAGQVASLPHMKRNDRRTVLRGWRRLLPRPRPRKASTTDLERIGIGVHRS